ncbi:hypothetical protein WJX72_008854 [[Myrmecia] bisecta]|uniref:WD repeat-containing protein 44 n=1 Tax=[Myrmecia] bisecta TaxID=41462 RepID=A0AAW1Q7A8_9CHLO
MSRSQELASFQLHTSDEEDYYESADEAAVDAALESPATRPSSTRSLGSVDSQPSSRTPSASGRLAMLNIIRRDSAGSTHEPKQADSGAHAGPSAGDESSDGELQTLRIKDLDTGKEYNLDKRFTIRDLNTGQLDSPAPGSPASPGRVTEVTSGQELSLEEFEQALGLNSVLEAARRRAREPPGRSASGDYASGSGEYSNGTHSMDARRVAGIGNAEGKPKKGGAWLKKKLFAKSRMGTGSGGGNSGQSSPVSASSRSTTHSFRHEDSEDEGRARSSGIASPSGRNGIPVKVQVHKKSHKELADLTIVQELHAHSGVVWTMKFSRNGRYLATAGQDTVVRVWEVLDKRGSPEAATADAAAANGSSGGSPTRQDAGEGVEGGSPHRGFESECPVFKPMPHRAYNGHKQDVLDLCWSKSQFLLSASMDKTVRLWHITMDECLRVFRHTDFVTALDFHPVDDKYFLSGSIDGKVRVWNIPEQRVTDWADVHEMVTATNFSADGKRVIVGTMKGKCRFYQCEGTFKLEYEAQIDVKNKRGKQRGRKITGMQFLPGDSAHLLITSNDSRVRLYNGYMLQCKYKGHQNRNTQIRATFSSTGDYIISGSDDGWVYMWNTVNFPPQTNSAVMGSWTQDKNGSYECFHAHDDIVTVALFAPETAWRALKRPIYPDQNKATAALLHQRANGSGNHRKLSKEEAAEAAAMGEAAYAAGRAYGQVILSAGYSGEIKVFENLALPLAL